MRGWKNTIRCNMRCLKRPLQQAVGILPAAAGKRATFWLRRLNHQSAASCTDKISTAKSSVRKAQTFSCPIVSASVGQFRPSRRIADWLASLLRNCSGARTLSLKMHSTSIILLMSDCGKASMEAQSWWLTVIVTRKDLKMRTFRTTRNFSTTLKRVRLTQYFVITEQATSAVHRQSLQYAHSKEASKATVRLRLSARRATSFSRIIFLIRNILNYPFTTANCWWMFMEQVVTPRKPSWSFTIVRTNSWATQLKERLLQPII